MGAVGRPGRDDGIPADLTALVGRRGEVTRIRRMLATARLVTLTGVGGVGKTRLGFQVAAAVTRGSSDDVHLVELAALRDEEFLAQEVATALGLVDRSGRPTLQVVVDHLQGRRSLLLLDNCEHLVGGCARLVDTLLRALPGLRVLATSRQALRLTGEQIFQVPPLCVPPSPGPAAGKAPGRYPAVTLFEQRAAAVRPGFRVTAENADAVVRLVGRLDGVPLAIELAAARMRTLSPQELLDRLAGRFDLLTLGSRAAPPRQRTLRGVIDWSHALCTEQERAVWARSSVFAGGFDLAGLEAVCVTPDLPAQAVTEAVDGLVDKSLLLRQEVEGRSRFAMLGTVREYGQEQLAASGELAVYRARHRDHWLAMSARAQAASFGPAQVGWFARLRADHADVRTALGFCRETPGEAAAGLALAMAPRHYWITRGSLSEGRQWLSRLLDAEARDGTASPLRARALSALAYLTILHGAPEEALPLIAEARAAAERLGDAATLAWTEHHLGVVASFAGDLDRSSVHFETALEGHRALDDLGAACECLFKLALVAVLSGDHPRAEALCRECETATTEHGESWVRGLSLFTRGLLRWKQGDGKAADALAREAVRLLRPFGDWWDIAMCVEISAWSAAAGGAHDRAARLLGVLDALWTTVGGRLSTAPFMAGDRRVCETAVRDAIGDAAFEHAVRQGADLPVSQALDYVLRDTADHVPRDTAGRSGTAGLTRRERQVADLVARGMTNKEIADHLVLARRTAENHVERALAKLGLTSRTQLAVWVHERGVSVPGHG
ncbi:ATP-binding protein [Actinacidiphila acidipaludis]|uniref:LuxR C-terminal-related transcriptional regulator n=1 Tax=Actinacidiphila acidipaludis TaxID=2873382 RepID=A0ABS7QEB2_9ACTN|nr:LuxR C-terminal-related transcriptional regulator [Streptomyces acidipaludis]MBY8880262.1 LuxR C-terminal-related transcriptional regulator [Streptomyces acidipaludis]